MKKLFYPLFLLGACLANAQGYKSIDPSRAYLFSYHEVGANYDVAGFKVDSIESTSEGQDYFFNKTFERNSELCYALTPAWIGARVSSQDDLALDVFRNKYGQTITLKRNARLGEEWSAFVSSAVIVKARVSKIAYENHLEGLDSIKTISFSAYSPSEWPLDYQLNNLSIKISKNKGLVQAINFANFPGLPSSYAPELETYYILGATHPTAGIQPFTKASIYNFTIGDEFHTKEVKFAFSAVSSYYDTTNKISTVINRTETIDSILLTFRDEIQYIQAKEEIGYPSYSVSYIIEYSSLKIPKGDIILPASSRVVNGKLLFYTQHYENALQKLIETSPGRGNYTSSNGEFCLDFFFCDAGGDEVNYYLKSLGGPYFDLRGCGKIYRGWDKKLVYSLKNYTIETGTPLEFNNVITGLDETSTTQTAIFPNPFSDELRLNGPKGTISNIQITDMQGNRMLRSEIHSIGEQTLNTSSFIKGLYFVSVTDAEGKITTYKLLKK